MRLVLGALSVSIVFAQGKLAPSSPPAQPKEISLTPSAQAAVDLSGKWTSADDKPIVSQDGRVMYAFGNGLPVVVCAPLRVCVIELQAGEKLASEPQIGDALRWNAAPAVFGSGAGETNIIVLKPQEAGLDTDLLIPTDRRVYYLRLVSREKEYVARTAFRYAEDDSADKWRKRIEQQRLTEQKTDQRQVLLPAAVTAEQLNFGYTVTGSPHIKPTKVYDDNTHTFFRMPAEIRSREAPILMIVGVDGKEEVTNYRVTDGLTYVVDRLADHFTLTLGKGKKAEKVDIKRDARERT